MKGFVPGIVCLAVTAGVMWGQEGTFDRTFTVSGPVELDVQTDSGGITVQPGAAGSVRVHAILKGQHGWFASGDVADRIRQLERNPPVEQNGNHVRLGYVQDKSLLRDVSIRLEIQTPPDTRLRARADSGGIHVEGLHGTADCHTDSGGIEIHNIGADVRASADSGGIRISDVNGSVTARVDSGGIDATNVTGSLDAQADSGGIRLGQTHAAPIHAKSDSGGITVKLASGAGYDISAQSDSGHISVPEMTVHGETSRQHVEGKVRSGGPLVNLRVESGNITIE